MLHLAYYCRRRLRFIYHLVPNVFTSSFARLHNTPFPCLCCIYVLGQLRSTAFPIVFAQLAVRDARTVERNKLWSFPETVCVCRTVIVDLWSSRIGVVVGEVVGSFIINRRANLGTRGWCWWWWRKGGLFVWEYVVLPLSILLDPRETQAQTHTRLRPEPGSSHSSLWEN